MRRTYSPKAGEIERGWCVVDADGVALGRLSSRVAHVLMGKHKPTYVPHLDTGDFVIVVNAEKVKFTGKKWDDKTYQTYSHYTGGQKIIPAKEMRERKPGEIIRLAVKRMMPRGPLAYKQIKKLKIYVGPSHDHQAQQPIDAGLVNHGWITVDPLKPSEGYCEWFVGAPLTTVG